MDVFTLLDDSARLLDRDADSVRLGDQLDQLEYVFDAVTDSVMLDQMTNMIDRYRKRLAERGSR